MSHGADIYGQFQAFLLEPSHQAFSELRESIIRCEQYQPYADEFVELDRLMQAEDYAAAEEFIQSRMPNLLLSPRAHLMLSRLAEANQGEQELASAERAAAMACVDGIQATGDGSRRKPYLVLRTSDEYDLLEFLQVKSTRQRLVHEADRHFDVLTGEDGAEYWFDITAAFDHLDDLLRE